MNISADIIRSNMMQIIPGRTNASIRDGRRALYPIERTLLLDKLVNQRFWASLGRRGLLLASTAQAAHKVNDVAVDGRVQSEDRQYEKVYNITVKFLCVTQYGDNAPGASKDGPIWSWFTL